MAPFGKEFARELWGQPLSSSSEGSRRRRRGSVVCKEGHVGEDEVQAAGLAVGKRADHERHPVLEAGGREGRDARLGGDGVLDEVVLAAEVGEEEGDAAEGLVVAGVEDACFFCCVR